MKKLYSLLLALAMVLIANIQFAYSQVPDGFSYQAVIRNSTGTPITSQIRLKISLQSQAGNIYYSESHLTTPNNLGVISLNVGSGTLLDGSFASVLWGSGDVYIKFEIDQTGGTNYVAMGSPTKLLSVPYSQSAGNGIASITNNGNGTFTYNYSNGDQYTTPNLTGPQGPAGVDGKSIRWLGDATSAPISPVENDAYYNTTLGKSFIWDGTTWQIIAQDGLAGASGGVSLAGTQGQMIVHNGTEWVASSTIMVNSDTVSIGTVTPISKLIVQGESTALPEDPIFEVRNKDNKLVLGVYNEGIRMYVEDSQVKGAKSGFAIGGLTNQGKGETEYFRVTPDSARITFNKPVKGAKGGFAVGGLTNKASQDIMLISHDSARIWVNNASAKGAKGGFAVGGLTNKKENSNFILLTPENYLIGHQAGGNTTTGLYNSFFGYQSGFSNTEGSKNIFLGRYTGYYNNYGNQNIFIGDSTGYNNTSGFANLFLGVGSGTGNQDGYWNIFLGRRSGYSNTSGYANIIAGDYAGYANTTGTSNVFIGDYCGANNTIGNTNVFIGKESGWNNTEGEENVFLGAYSGYKNLTGNWNVFLGKNSGYNNTTGGSNVALGLSAGYGLETGSYNVMLGTMSGNSNTDGNQNTFLGQETGYYNTTGSYNVFTGCLAGYSNTTGYSNIYIGQSAGYYNTGGNWNTYVGTLSGYSNSTGEQNSFFGNETGYSNTIGNYNTFVGVSAGYSNTEGEQNVLLGQRAGYSTTAGSWNVMIGSRTGYLNTTGAQNVFIGNRAGYNNNSDGNVFIGSMAGYNEAGSNLLYIENSDASADQALIFGDFYNNTLQFNGNTYAIDGTANSDSIAFSGKHEVSANYGIGVEGRGGWFGVKGIVDVYNGVGTRYGIYGYAYGGATNWAGYFDGNAYATSYFQSSDKNLKRNIQTIGDALKKVLELNGVTYEWKSESELSNIKSSLGKKKGSPKFDFPTGMQYGVVAQEVETVLPEVVLTDSEGLKSVDYMKIVPVLIEAIKEQQKQIELLKQEVELLKTQK